MFFLGYGSETSISLKENSVKPNIKADHKTKSKDYVITKYLRKFITTVDLGRGILPIRLYGERVTFFCLKVNSRESISRVEVQAGKEHLPFV